MNVLAIDQGTTSTKALVVGPDHRVLGEGRAPVSPRAVGPGLVEQDAQELLDSIVTAGRAALRAAGGAPVGAVGIANQGETVVACDRASGRPLAPALSWQDRRAAPLAERLAADGAGARLTELTGLPLDPYFSAPKLAWLAAEHPGAEILPIDAWIVRELTGRLVTDAATASRTLLLDLDAVAWSAEACELFGLSADALPEIADCAGDFGATDAFDAGAPLPLTGLCVDQQAALFAESCLAPGEAKCTYGTGAFLLAQAGAAPVRSSAGLAACVAWRLGGEAAWCLDGQVYTAGAAVEWLRRLGLVDGAAGLDAACAAAGGPTADRPLFVPGLAGLGAPFWAPHARGGWSGLSLATGRDELVAAVVEGIAAQVATLAQAMTADLGRSPRALRVDGGLTQSRALMQAQADLLQAPVELYPSPDATALGMAAFARLGAGAAASVAEALPPWRPAAVFEPSIAADEAAERLGRWRAAADALASLSSPPEGPPS